MTKKILVALGISMMSALPMTQASPTSTDSIFNKPIPMEDKIEIDKAFNYFSSKDNKKNPPPVVESEDEEDYNDNEDKNKKNPPPKKAKKKKANDGNDNPPPPPSDEEDFDNPGSKGNKKLKTKVAGSSVKKVKEKEEKRDIKRVR